jgi:two-component system sensor histidine kinase KdpD
VGRDEIDVYVLSGEADTLRPQAMHMLEQHSDWPAYGWGLAIVVLCTVLAWLVFPFFGESNLIMIYLLGIVAVARRCGRGPSILASVLSVVAFDFFFVPPYLTFAVSDVEYLVTLPCAAVALIIGSDVRLQQQAAAARQRERRTAALYAMSRDLANRRDTNSLLAVATRHISEVFESHVALLLPDVNRHLQTRMTGEERHATGQSMLALDAKELGVAQWVYEHQQMAGLGTATLPSTEALYVPLIASRGVVGVLGVRPVWPRPLLALELEQVHLLETFASQIALALERATLAEEAQNARAK